MSEATFCWMCGKPLIKVNGQIVFSEIVPHPAATEKVRVHVVCGDNHRDGVVVENEEIKSDIRRYLNGY